MATKTPISVRLASSTKTGAVPTGHPSFDTHPMGNVPIISPDVIDSPRPAGVGIGRGSEVTPPMLTPPVPNPNVTQMSVPQFNPRGPDGSPQIPFKPKQTPSEDNL